MTIARPGMLVFRPLLRQFLVAVSAGAAILLSPPASKAAEFDVGANARCPEAGAFDTERALPRREDLLLRGSNQYSVIVPDAQLRQTSELIAPVGGAELVFGDRLELLTISEADSRVGLFKQRATEDGDRCGWTRLENAQNLGRLQPLRVTDLPGRENDEVLDGTVTRLDAQVVARASRASDGALIPAPLFSKPDSSKGADDIFRFELDRPISYFAVASVLDITGDANAAGSGDGTCEDIRDRDCFMLLGGANESGQEDVLGWVRGSDVELWPSTLSLYYAEGRSNVPYFLSYCGALGEIEGQDPGLCKQETVGFGRHTEVSGNNVPRFPIISVDQFETPGGGESFLYEVVAPLAVCKKGSQREECRDPTEIIGEEGRVQIGLDKLRTVDVMFVIDGTASMEAYFEPTVQAAVAFANTLARSQEISARFAAAVYGDYSGPYGQPDAVSFLRVADFGNVGDASNLEGLLHADRIQQLITDAHMDQPEAPFAGIIRAVDPRTARWRGDAGVRLVIWIGDVGNRDPGNQTTNAGPLNEMVDIPFLARQVAAAGDEGLTAIRFAAINVPSLRPEDRARNQRDFLDDYEQVRQALAGSDFDVQIVQPGDPAAAQTQVRAALDEILTAVRAAERCVAGELDCEAVPLDGGSSEPLADNSYLPMQIGFELATELGLVGEGIDEKGLQEDEIIAVEKVFVVQEADDPAFDYWLALRPRELEELINDTARVCDEMDYRDFGPELLESYVTVLETATRRPVDRDLSPAEFLATVLSVPKRTFSQMLGYPFVDLLDALEADDDLADRFQSYACMRTEILRLVAEGRRAGIDDLVWEDNRVGFRPDFRPEDFAWDWSGMGGGNRYFFFPISFLP